MIERDTGERRRFRAKVRGRVQAVNFRSSTVRKARQLQIVGYVRNAWDGTVEVVAEGPAGALQRFVSWLHSGPRMARVTDIEVHWQVPRHEFSEFEVRF